MNNLEQMHHVVVEVRRHQRLHRILSPRPVKVAPSPCRRSGRAMEEKNRFCARRADSRHVSVERNRVLAAETVVREVDSFRHKSLRAGRRVESGFGLGLGLGLGFGFGFGGVRNERMDGAPNREPAVRRHVAGCLTLLKWQRKLNRYGVTSPQDSRSRGEMGGSRVYADKNVAGDATAKATSMTRVRSEIVHPSAKNVCKREAAAV